VLHSVSIRRGGEDRLWWVSLKKKLFKVGSFFSSLACFEGVAFLGRVCGRLRLLGKILTLNNLRKMHVISVDRCCMCKQMGNNKG
jgi:hypothetical protein